MNFDVFPIIKTTGEKTLIYIHDQNHIFRVVMEHDILSFIIPLCSNELRILNPYRGCSIRAIPAPFDVTRCALLCRR